MPDPVPAASAPAAAAPTSTPAPVTAPTPSPAPSSESKPTSKELAGKLFSLLTAPAPNVDEPAKPKPAAPETKAPAAKEPEAEKPITRKKKDEPKAAPAPTPEGEKAPPVPKKEDLNKPTAAAAAPAPTPAKAEPSEADFEKDLVDEERAQLEDARSAEKYLPEKYKGQGAKMTAFLKENAKKTAQVEKGEIDQAEYEAWYEKSLPKISVLDQRHIQRLAVKEDVTKEFEPKIAEERHARWVDTEAPKIKAKGNEIYNKLSSSALPDDVMAAITERTKGITDRGEYLKKVQEVQKDYALEFEIAESVINVATNDIEEFHRLTTVNPATGKSIAAFEANNPTHERLVNMVTELCNEFKATGGAELKKDGKWFVTREEWQGMAPEQRGPFWTFTNEQIVDRALGKVKAAVSNLVAQEHKRLESRGFKRTIASAVAPTPPAQPSSQGAPPAPRPTPPPAGGGTPQPSIAATLAGKLTSQPAAL